MHRTQHDVGFCQLREAGIEDVPHIAQINSDTLRECGLETPEMFDVERLRKRWIGYVRGLHQPQYALEPRLLVAAFAEHSMVGYIAGHFSRRYDTEGELQSLYVLKEHHGKGIGTSLLMHLAGWFGNHDRRAVCVGIDPANPYRRFYEKHGARYLNKHWLVWDDIGVVLQKRTDQPEENRSAQP
jgi:GNAT superfamily N-acetyltransferase